MIQLEEIFKGLADTTRLRILNLLLQGERCVCDIQRVLGSPQSNISRHLIYLKNAGLVADRRDGPRMYYRLAQSRQRVPRLLFVFLAQTFRACPELREESRKLRQAIRSGSCTAATWHARRKLAAIGGRGGRR